MRSHKSISNLEIIKFIFFRFSSVRLWCGARAANHAHWIAVQKVFALDAINSSSSVCVHLAKLATDARMVSMHASVHFAFRAIAAAHRPLSLCLSGHETSPKFSPTNAYHILQAITDPARRLGWFDNSIRTASTGMVGHGAQQIRTRAHRIHTH